MALEDAVVEDQVHEEMFITDEESLLSGFEAEAVAHLQQELLQAVEQAAVDVDGSAGHGPGLGSGCVHGVPPGGRRPAAGGGQRGRSAVGKQLALVLFVKRDVVTVYKQTILGPLWYLIQPLFTSITFTIIFNINIIINIT